LIASLYSVLDVLSIVVVV